MLEYLIRQLIKQKVQTPQDLAKQKREGAFLFKQKIPTNIQMLKVYHDLLKKGKVKKYEWLEKLLKTRQIRTSSGVAVVTVLTKPWPCPGKCLYCPSEKDMPKSYLKNEPAAQRAHLAKFDPHLQVKTRLDALKMTGHETDKIELIVLGGTWSAYPVAYQYWFIKECFRACNEGHVIARRPASRRDDVAIPWMVEKGRDCFASLARTLKKQQRKNETASHRIVGLTLETRPDYINLDEIKQMRDLGCTRVELGVQSIYDDILKKNRRGHTVADTTNATKLLKDAGFKINYHMMLNLPGSTPKRDEKMFEEIFSNPDFQPDLLKIYPCVVLKTAPLYKLWKQGGYKPHSEKQLINLILRVKQKIPPYVRIQRIIRDIPGASIVAGSKLTNLRQIIHNHSHPFLPLLKGEVRRGLTNPICSCIRCREIRGQYLPTDKIKLFRREYQASGGKEIFLSFESPNQKKIYALLRLRIPSYYFCHSGEGRNPDSKPGSRVKPGMTYGILPALRHSALIRELHTYGQLVPLTTDNRPRTTAAQHKGLGKQLMAEAEKIVRKETDLKSIAVISGIGVRQYYKKLGYKLKDEYMVKNIK